MSATEEPATPVPTERTPEPVVTNQRVLIAIQGMTCGGCQAGVTRGLYATSGVENADVSFRKGQAIVVYDPTVISPDGLVDAIHAMGSKYSARVLEDEPV
ncbi:MAG: heavy metal-associated domain-containing protein [Methanopyri archaeon]|nr:heavy metal-associated domain-containing protein [Methanopyri archaeon]